MSHFGEDHGHDALSGAFIRMSADLRHELAVEARAERQALEQLANDEAKFAGLLRDVAERGVTVVVDTTVGRRHRGTIDAVGKDYCVIDGIIVTTRALAAVQLPGAPQAVSAREPEVNAQRLEDLLADYAAQRLHVRLWLDGQQVPKAGEVHSVGDDVVTLDFEGQTVVVPIARIAEATLG